jgi:hypothetical protein
MNAEPKRITRSLSLHRILTRRIVWKKRQKLSIFARARRAGASGAGETDPEFVKKLRVAKRIIER